MANIHEVHAVGWMPFNAYNGDKNDPKIRDFRDWLAYFNIPTIGLKLEYPNRNRSVNNDRGGVTTYCAFRITGSEAIWSKGIEELVRAFEAVGCQFEMAKCRDIENNTRWWSIPVNTSNKFVRISLRLEQPNVQP